MELMTSSFLNKRQFLTGAFGVAALAGVAAGDAPGGDERPCGQRFVVTDFGAKGDGKTADTAAIQAAIDAAAKVGGTVFFPPGEYRCHDLKLKPSVTLLADAAWLYRGEKHGAVLQLDDPNAAALVDVTGAFAARVRGLTLNGLGRGGKPVHGIYLNNPKKWSPREDTLVFDDVKVQFFSGHGIFLDRIWLFIIRHSICFGNGGCGVCIRGWDGFVTDNQFSGNALHGFGCLECGATVMFTANRVEWNHACGLYLCNGDAWNVTGNSFDCNGGAGLYMQNVRGSTATGNVFRRCGKDVSRPVADGGRCQVRLSGCAGIAFTGNTCRAGRDQDGGKGKFTPSYGLTFAKMSHSVVASNALAAGYLEEMFVDEGGHGEQFALRDNVGYAAK